METPFIKMEGAGNDYIYVDAIRGTFPIESAAKAARTWSDRHFGIGADGLILLLPSKVAAVRMAMWNADGSQGRMCGNGLRCIAKLAHDHGHVRNRSFLVAQSSWCRLVAASRWSEPAWVSFPCLRHRSTCTFVDAA
jgi:diaminopimelate epimerase